MRVDLFFRGFSVLLAALLLAVVCDAQYTPPQKLNANYQFKAVGGDSALRIPKGVPADKRYLDSGSVAYFIADSSLRQWTGSQWVFIGKAGNGLHDSVGVVGLGGPLYKETTVDMRYGHSIWFKQDSNAATPVIIGDTNMNNLGFCPSLLISSRSQACSANAPFLSMSSPDACCSPTGAGAGFLFLNYQDQLGYVYPNMRMSTPAPDYTVAAGNIDLMSNKPRVEGASFWVSIYNITQSDTVYGNKIYFNDGPLVNHGFFKVDSDFHTYLGPWWGAADMSRAAGTLDLRETNGLYGLVQESAKKFNPLSGQWLMTEQPFNYTMTATPSAQVEVQSVTKGFLPPRMTTVQKLAIPSPAEGLEVYDLTLHKLCVFTGSVWETITSS